MKSILYYTENRLDPIIMNTVQNQILKSGLPITSVSLKPMDFGDNYVVDLEPGAVTMTRQILIGLEQSKADVVFLTEHDVLYHQSHYDFTPPRNDTYYFNTNVWRWWYLNDHFITYDNLVSLSGLCANRELLLNHYQKRLEMIEENGWGNGRDPDWARTIGHAPGKSRKSGGILDEKVSQWRSEYPNIDIRHGKTATGAKVRLNNFYRPPINWQEAKFSDIPEWDLKEMFQLCD